MVLTLFLVLLILAKFGKYNYLGFYSIIIITDYNKNITIIKFKLITIFINRWASVKVIKSHRNISFTANVYIVLAIYLFFTFHQFCSLWPTITRCSNVTTGLLSEPVRIIINSSEPFLANYKNAHYYEYGEFDILFILFLILSRYNSDRVSTRISTFPR